MNDTRRTRRPSYSLPLPPVIFLGSILAAGFFGLIYAGPLDFEILRRYCLSHPVAIASVSLFFVGIVALVWKWVDAVTQANIMSRAAAALRRLIVDGKEVSPSRRAEWLSASWEAQPDVIRYSWFGLRIIRAIELQVARGRRHQLEGDMKSLSEADGDRQHESFSLLRIIHWAMPMLGFLGTVLGISQTLGQLDVQMLATQQEKAMNQLTAGLYVAFDTTAIALTLTVFSMFVQFAVSRIEMNLLTRIDVESGDGLIGFLSVDPFDAQDTLLTPVREMATELIATVQQLVESQASTWSRSISESQRQWSQWTENASDKVENQLGQVIGEALHKHVAGMERLQDEGSRQIDLRWQQWQLTLSDQSRMVQAQQKEIVRQSELLQELVASTADLRKLEETIHGSVERLENVGRIETATKCVGEAVAVLATSLERAGLIRGVPVKPRSTKPLNTEHATSTETKSEENSLPITLPIDTKRKAA